jgi:hypothetical protein
VGAGLVCRAGLRRPALQLVHIPGSAANSAGSLPFGGDEGRSFRSSDGDPIALVAAADAALYAAKRAGKNRTVRAETAVTAGDAG